MDKTARQQTRRWNQKQKDCLAWLEAFGHPEAGKLIIHIVGTNGKGSTGRAIAQVLQDLLGLDVGHFISPHVHRYNERILCNSQPISDERLAAIQGAMAARPDLPAMPYFNQSFIEACLAYRDYPIWVMEAGIGAREDCTEILPFSYAVLTTMAMDHMNTLGDSLEAIAWQKADAVLPGHATISANQDPRVMAVLTKVAVERGAAIQFFDPSMVSGSHLTEEGAFAFHFDHDWLSGDYAFAMAGKHQEQNFGTALLALETILKDLAGADLGTCSTYQSFQRQAEAGDWASLQAAVCASIGKARLPGRFECISTHPLILIDGAHNPQAIDMLMENLTWLQLMDHGGPNLIFGMHDGKMTEAFRQHFFHHFHAMIEVKVEDTPDATIIEEVAQALDQLVASDPDRPIIVAGSLYILDGAWRWVQARRS